MGHLLSQTAMSFKQKLSCNTAEKGHFSLATAPGSVSAAFSLDSTAAEG